MAEATAGGHRRLAVLGDGELAEITAIVSEELRYEIVGFIAPESSRKRIVGRPVVADWNEMCDVNGAILATFDNPHTVYATFRAAQPDVPIFVPRQLNALLWRSPRPNEPLACRAYAAAGRGEGALAPHEQ